MVCFSCVLSEIHLVLKFSFGSQLEDTVLYHRDRTGCYRAMLQTFVINFADIRDASGSVCVRERGEKMLLLFVVIVVVVE